MRGEKEGGGTFPPRLPEIGRTEKYLSNEFDFPLLVTFLKGITSIHHANCTYYDCVPSGIRLCLFCIGWILFHEWLSHVSARLRIVIQIFLFWQPFCIFHYRYLVIKARKQYGVEYPWLYAPESNKHHKEFNSAQRAHQQTLESYSLVMLQMCLCGLVYPITSAICGK